MKKHILLLLVGVLAPLSVAMAQGTVRGKIVDEMTGEPVEFVNIVVSPKESSSLAGGTITDEQGVFRVDGLKYGSYVLTVSYIGYQNTTREFTLSATAKHAHFKQIAISEDNQMLKEVEVTGIRSQMKFEIDKKVFNVDQAIAATGGSASEVLQNIPSVEVDTEGTVSLRGSESVTVWINGKAQGLTADNQGDILEQMPAESIERIEVITNPSAKYSPEGTVGIINIVLKRDRKAGYYGSAQAGASMYDTDFGGYNASANINYSSGKLDAYANISYRERRHHNENTSYRENYLGNDTTYLDQQGRGSMRGGNMFARAGVTWHPTAKDHLSFDLMGMMGGNSHTNDIFYEGGLLGTPDYTRRRTSTSSGDMLMYNLSLGYKHEWSTTHYLDFTASRHSWGNEGSNAFADSTFRGGLLDHQSFQLQDNTGDNTEYELQLDYENAFNDNHKLQAGYRGTFSRDNSPVSTYSDPDRQNEIVPLYYNKNAKGYSEGWIQVVKNSIAQIAPHYTMKRQLDDYYTKFYNKLGSRFAVLSANDNAKAKEIAAWKETVAERWDAIEVVSATNVSELDVTSGSEIKLTVVLDEKGLDNAVGVECVTIETDSEGKEHIHSIDTLELVKKENNLHTFECTATVNNAGFFKVAYRMYPKNADLPHRQDFCYVRWF